MIYITIITYGMGVLTAVIEEKGTRISEILFSSVNSFTLMMGKLIGVSLVGLTQYVAWALMYLLLALIGASRGYDLSGLPHFSLVMFLYLLLYFLIGYFLYETAFERLRLGYGAALTLLLLVITLIVASVQVVLLMRRQA